MLTIIGIIWITVQIIIFCYSATEDSSLDDFSLGICILLNMVTLLALLGM